MSEEYCCELYTQCLFVSHGECCIHNDRVPPCGECDMDYVEYTLADHRRDDLENTCSVCGINWLSEGGCSHLYDGSSED